MLPSTLVGDRGGKLWGRGAGRTRETRHHTPPSASLRSDSSPLDPPMLGEGFFVHFLPGCAQARTALALAVSASRGRPPYPAGLFISPAMPANNAGRAFARMPALRCFAVPCRSQKMLRRETRGCFRGSLRAGETAGSIGRLTGPAEETDSSTVRLWSGPPPPENQSPAAASRPGLAFIVEPGVICTGLRPSVASARNCPHAAAMSLPRDSRTNAEIPRASSRSTK